MTVEVLRYANRAAVAKALTAQGYEVTRMTVNRWARGGEMPRVAEGMILRLFGHDPEHEETPRPQWAEGLEDRVVAGVVSALATPELLEAAQRAAARLAALPPQSDAPHAADAGSRDPGAGAQ